jgi:hypothetical protein
MGMTRPDYAREVRNALSDPRKLVEALGLTEKAKRQPTGAVICCPVHGDRTPSCSVTRGPDGTVRVRCFSCDFSGDALTLISVVRGLSLRSAFKEVLLEGATIAGLHSVADELRGSVVPSERKPPPEIEREPDPEYPPIAEVKTIWELGRSVAEDPGAAAHILGRKLEPSDVARFDLARVLPRSTTFEGLLPIWARYGQKNWRLSGHRMIVKAFDCDGYARSLRAWRIEGDAAAKRIPPKGKRATGLVLANAAGALLLRGKSVSTRVVIVEGEPDWLTWSIRAPRLPVIGVISGSWSDGFTARIPYGGEVMVRTHTDRAGDKYAEDIIKSVRVRAQVHRLQADPEQETEPTS